MVKKKEEVVAEPVSVELPKSRIQEKKEAHEKAAEERANIQKLLKAEYFKVKESPALQDLMKKLHGFVDYHTKVAKDGIGYEQYTNATGDLQQKTVRFTPEERVSHLDKAAGLEEILDYIERQLI